GFCWAAAPTATQIKRKRGRITSVIVTACACFAGPQRGSGHLLESRDYGELDAGLWNAAAALRRTRGGAGCAPEVEERTRSTCHHAHPGRIKGRHREATAG